MARPESSQYSPFMQPYMDCTFANTINELVSLYHQEILDFYLSIPETKSDYSYASDKWTVKQVLQHVIDTDMIFVYRALAISRGETKQLPGFDQDQYARLASSENSDFDAIKILFLHQRNLIKYLVLSFSNEQLQRIGSVSDYHLSVNAACFVLFGHALHHLLLLKDRYGIT